MSQAADPRRGIDTSRSVTNDMIAAAMTKVDARTCVPGDNRCYPFPYNLAGAQATCTPKGRCKVGWIVRASGREAWDV